MNTGLNLHKLDPLSKLVALFSVALLAMYWDTPAPLLLLLTLLLVLARYGAGIGWLKLLGRMGYIILFALPLFVITAISVPGEGAQLFPGLSISAGAVSYAAAISLRMFCMFLSSVVYIWSTDPQDFVVIMANRLKLPYRLVYGVSMALAFLPLLEKEGRIQAQARKLRFGRAPRGLRERAMLRRESLVAVFSGAIRRVEQTAGAMEAKGFGAYSSRTYLREVRIERSGYVIMLTSVIFASVMMMF